MAENEAAEDTLLTLTADIVAAHVSNNSVAVNDLPNLIQNVHQALSGISGPRGGSEEKQEPKVSIRSSVKPDFISCLDCGKKQKMLKRHLMTNHEMTPTIGRNGDFRRMSRWLRPIMPSSAVHLPSRLDLGRSAAGPARPSDLAEAALRRLPLPPMRSRLGLSR